jgi:hypothetical protein
MNISTGGPHILFFERDSQLTALLTSEFQLAGYECHAARTAVEVFDTIARFPVRMLLVNLAQAAAGRREFWVALDTQRRGRGVQVLTYLCSNLAGYGPRDVDERPQFQAVDVEINGMLGLMNLVDAVRERIPNPNAVSSLNTQPRMPRVTQAPQPPPSTPNFSGVPTTPRQLDTDGASLRTGPLADTLSHQIPRSAPAATQTVAPATTLNPQSYSEKIRAVLYPTPTQEPTNYTRTSLPPQEVAANTRVAAPPQPVEQPSPSHQETPQRVTYYGQQSQQQNGQRNEDVSYSAANATALQQLAYGSQGTQQESGLDQLSRLLQERRTPTQDTGGVANSVSAPYYEAGNGVADNRYAPGNPEQPSVNYVQTPQTPRVTESLDAQSLRAAPIEDLPRERTNGSVTSDTTRRGDTGTRPAYGQYGYAVPQNSQAPSNTVSSTPLASIATLRTPAPVVAKATMPIPAVQPIQNTPPPVEEANYFSPPVQQMVQEPVQQPVQEMPSIPETPVLYRNDGRDDELVMRADTALPSQRQPREDEVARNEVETRQNTQEQLQQEYTSMQNILQGRSGTGIAPNNAMLLDIVQSLPMMPSPPPQPQAVSGRTMRSLGSVLLEGHLVPENRLEVAQNIQRMLRGVDLNYQLGEILLMFKLLTPDQLLAASLVSYGMISTQQISALGRIRQELHSIGLEYDLESLLILFRMLTAEQLREIRTSWIS